MKETYESINETLNNDAEIARMRGKAAITLQLTNDRRSWHYAADFPILIYPLGASQVASTGELNENGYFCITVTLKKMTRFTSSASDFLPLGERIVTLLHRSRHAGRSVVFSKNIVAHSSFVLENSNRRINVKVNEGEIVQALFFWTNAATVAMLDNAGQSPSSGLGLSTQSAETAEREAAKNAVSASAELFP